MKIDDCRLKELRANEILETTFAGPNRQSEICNLQSEIARLRNNQANPVSNTSVSSLMFHFSFEKGSEVMVTLIVVYNAIVLIGFIQETQTQTDFNDLGKLLLAGVVAAIVFAVGFTLVRMRLRDKNPPASNFISISSPLDKNENVGS